MIYKTFIIILKVILVLVAFILLYLLTAFVLSRITVEQEIGPDDDVDIYLLTNGIHSDIVVPTITYQMNWYKKLGFLKPPLDPKQYRYLAIGWGDKGFYLNTPSWSQLKVSTALKATVGVSGTAIHATYHKKMTENESCKKIKISKEQYNRLIRYIENSFEQDEKGNFLQIDTEATKSDRDAFYEATGRYHIFNTCNSWTNRGLKYAGQNACLWTAFQKPIFLKYK
jgi:uncharacterized protein (TIGR02117 family)